MSRLQLELSRRMPEAELLVEYLRPEKVYDAVLTEQADLGLVSYPESNREIAAIPWREEKMMVAAAPSHPLATRETLDLADLARQNFVAFDDELRVGREVKRYIRESGAQLNVVMHFDNIQTMKEAVVLGSSISIMPVRVLRNDIEQGRLVAIPIKGCKLVRPLASSTAAARPSTGPRGPSWSCCGKKRLSNRRPPSRRARRRTVEGAKGEAAVHQALSRRSNSTAATVRRSDKSCFTVCQIRFSSTPSYSCR